MRKVMLIILIISLIFILGCKSNGDLFGGGKGGTDINSNFRTGSSSTSITFLKNMPPNPLYITDEFNIGLSVENIGAYNIENGTLTLSGFESTAFNFPDSHKQTFSSLSKNVYRKKGEQTRIFFDVKSICLPAAAKGQKKNFTVNFRATACYPYKTFVTKDICINPSRTQSEEGNCKVNEITLSGGQGGPIGVTKIRPKMILFQGMVNAKVDVDITVFSKDELIYQPNSYLNQCSQSKEKNNISVKIKLAGKECTTVSKEINIKGNKATASCTFPIDPAEGSYLTPLLVELDYSVSNSKLKKVILEEPSGLPFENCIDTKTVKFKTAENSKIETQNNNAKNTDNNNAGAGKTVDTDTTTVVSSGAKISVKSAMKCTDQSQCGSRQVCNEGYCLDTCVIQNPGFSCKDILTAGAGANACITGLCQDSSSLVLCCPDPCFEVNDYADNPSTQGLTKIWDANKFIDKRDECQGRDKVIEYGCNFNGEVNTITKNCPDGTSCTQNKGICEFTIRSFQ